MRIILKSIAILILIIFIGLIIATLSSQYGSILYGILSFIGLTLASILVTWSIIILIEK